VSVILDIADAVVASLNAGAFALEFEAARKYQPVFELQDMQTLHVSVVPKSLAITTAARDSGFFDVAIDIGVQKKVNADESAELDALMNLVEQIADHLRMKRLDDAPNAAWLGVANEPVFAPEHLEQWRQFTSVLTVTYRVRR
jgi:hypothetical protein